MMKNIIPKIVVVLSAIVLWFLIVSGQTYIGVIDMPLKAYEPREDKTLAEVLPQTVKVRVKGNGRNLYFQRWSKKSQLILDVGAISSSQTISLKEYFRDRSNQVRLQDDMQFLEVVYPDSIHISIDNKISKNVKVRVRSNISSKPGFILVKDNNERELTISGPEKLLKNINHVETEMITRENVELPLVEDVAIVNPNADLFMLSQDEIEVKFPVEMIGERSISGISIELKNKPDELDIQFIPNTVTLRITGGNTQIQSLDAKDFKVYFDYLTQWFPNKNYYSLKVKKPVSVLDVIDMSPQQVEVIVSKK